jgi:hypothetical protein
MPVLGVQIHTRGVMRLGRFRYPHPNRHCRYLVTNKILTIICLKMYEFAGAKIIQKNRSAITKNMFYNIKLVSD